MTLSLSHLVIRRVDTAHHERRVSTAHQSAGSVGADHQPTDSELDRALRAFYAELDDDVAARNPVCTNRGLCCRFSHYGHRLYVTDVELAYFVDGMHDRWQEPDDSGGCPYQIDGHCTARQHRPLGCRVFFCDPASADWQGPLYETYLARLKEIGQQFAIPYRYREWLSALRDVSVSGSTDPYG